jgi:hypothetical protein
MRRLHFGTTFVGISSAQVEHLPGAGDGAQEESLLVFVFVLE